MQPPNSGELPFRLDAFATRLDLARELIRWCSEVKVILKVGLMHLMYYGSTPQARGLKLYIGP